MTTVQSCSDLKLKILSNYKYLEESGYGFSWSVTLAFSRKIWTVSSGLTFVDRDCDHEQKNLSKHCMIQSLKSEFICLRFWSSTNINQSFINWFEMKNLKIDFIVKSNINFNAETKICIGRFAFLVHINGILWNLKVRL